MLLKLANLETDGTYFIYIHVKARKMLRPIGLVGLFVNLNWMELYENEFRESDECRSIDGIRV